MKNNSLKFKILSGVIVGCLSISAMGTLIYFNILTIKEHQQRMINAEKKILSVKKLQSQIIDMESGIRGYLLGGRSEDLEPFSKTEGLFDIQLKDTKNLLKDEKTQLQQLDEILEIKGKWIESAAVGEMLSRRKLQAGMINFSQFSESFVNSEGNDLILNLKAKVASIVELFDNQIIKMKANVSHLMEQILFIVLMGTIVTILVSFLVQFLILKSINKKFNVITENLSHSSKKLKKSGKESKQESLGLKDQCRNLNSGLESNAATLEEIGAMVKRTSDSAEHSVNLVESSQSNSVEGRKLLSNIEVSFKEITTSNIRIEETISGKLEQINKSLEAVDRISENTKLINDIVFQTKLLSFNASVEAARAGEHGKGFAVVAEEIGNLAKVSGDSAIKIESIIKEAKAELDGIIKESLNTTSNLFESNKNKLSTGSKFVEECSLKFEEVLQSVKSVGESFREINVATEEQATGVREIAQSASDFELTSKNCLSIAGKSLSNVEILENEISTLNHEINIIKKTIFGEPSGKKILSLQFWKKRIPSEEIKETNAPQTDTKIAS